MLEDIQKIRRRKLEILNNSGMNVYPGKSSRTNTVSEAIKKFSTLSKKADLILAGRIKLIREHGGSTFVDFEDGTGRFQAYFKKDKLGERGYKFFLDNFDIGDFVQLKGVLFTTKRGEKTIEASDFKMLAKSLLPLPEKWHGLQDVEERFRKRYLDLIMNADIRRKFETRSKIIREIRNFLEKEGFTEVETPILQTIPGGALARPFKTHLNALDIDLYLRVAPELYLKRLIVGGFEKVYEIGRCFRNEGIDFNHNPDFTMLEFYWAYHDYKDLMKLTEKFFGVLVKKLFKGLSVEYEGKKISFKPPFERIEFIELLQRELKMNLDDASDFELAKILKKYGIASKDLTSRWKKMDELYKKVCRPKILQPTFVMHHPIEMSPLAKALDQNPQKAARFQLVAGGMELCNAFSELNDPDEQKKRFFDQQKQREKFKDEETQRYDEDFIEALEYGMPPCVGFGMGIDRLAALLTDSHTLREVILFPTMKPR